VFHRLRSPIFCNISSEVWTALELIS
jgi:hypothetical protein